MSGPYELNDVPPPLRRRTNAIAIVAMTAIAAALMVLVLVVEGVRFSATTWVVLGLVAAVLIAGIVLAVRTFTPEDRELIAGSERRVLDPLPDLDPLPGPEVVDLRAAERVDAARGANPAPFDDEIVLDAAAPDIDLTHEPVVRVVLHPGPIMRRRLADRPDALVVVADRDALDVPGWIVEGRSRVIERTDRVMIPWQDIGRFRVRADSDGPDVYDITAASGADTRRWRIRRNEIDDEVELLDHVRRVGRITIELEDSIRS